MNDVVALYTESFGGWRFNVRGGKAFGPLFWSPDAKWLAFSRKFEDGASIWRVEISTGSVERLTVSY